MALLLKDGQTTDDTWTHLDAASDAVSNATSDAVPPSSPLPDGPIVVSLERWRRDRAELSVRNTPLGIRLRSDQLAPEIADDLQRFSLVVLEFPKFRDGRAFSTARELRERYHFTGEIRASGHVIPDQYQFLIRTGFTSVEVPATANLPTWRHALSEISVAYQPGILDDSPLSLLRRKVETNAR